MLGRHGSKLNRRFAHLCHLSTVKPTSVLGIHVGECDYGHQRVRDTYAIVV